MLAQSKTKKEYKKRMVEMVSLMDSGSEDEKSSTSSIKQWILQTIPLQFYH
ncbi:hypothetical protein Goari_012069 [Gossypium aridum]|uniref:Uncharacterized protein n=1 Tax=Gossypium aridum TaxID=34290 RepID=A0A7J8X093_GOSAI|nr:hypothetical protein [Gossypium aridum]